MLTLFKRLWCKVQGRSFLDLPLETRLMANYISDMNRKGRRTNG